MTTTRELHRFKGIRRADGTSMFLIEIIPALAFVRHMLAGDFDNEQTLALAQFARNCMELPRGRKPLCLTCDTELVKSPGRFCIIKGGSETHCLVTAQCRRCAERYSETAVAQHCIGDGTIEPVAPAGTA